MPFTVRYLPAEDVLLVRGFGGGDVHEGHRVVMAIQAHQDYRPGISVLLDIRELAYVPSAGDARKLASLYATTLPDSRVAVLAPPGIAFTGAINVERVAEALGARMVAFITQSEAMRWLTAQPTEQ
jgi:hypothetical protein